MVDNQPLALRLADTLAAGFECDMEWYEIAAARELRRLYAENVRLTASLPQQVDCPVGDAALLAAWRAWSATAGTEGTEFTLEKSSHGKAFRFAWRAALDAPQPRQPLSEEQIDIMFAAAGTGEYIANRERVRHLEIYSFGVRDAEAAHDIVEGANND